MPENQKLDRLKLKKEEIRFQKEVDKYTLNIEKLFSGIVDLSKWLKWEEFSTVESIPDIPRFKGTYEPIPKEYPKCIPICSDSHPRNCKEDAIMVWLGIIMFWLLKKKVFKNFEHFKYAWRLKPEAHITIEFDTMRKSYRVYSRSLFWSTNGK